MYRIKKFENIRLKSGCKSSVKKENEKGWAIEIRADLNASLARVVLDGNWEGDVKISLDVAREILKEMCNKWPTGKRVKCLITCGGFLEFVDFDWGDNPILSDPRESNKEIIKWLQSEAKKWCDLLLKNNLYYRLSKCTDYLTIGIDGYPKGYPKKPSIELVALINLRERKYYWTGKSYPTIDQEYNLIRISDLKSHFVNLEDFGRIMILGCHDLNMFNPRAIKNAKGWRAKVNREFRDLAKKKEPTCVLQHPHGTDSTRTWAAAWSNLRSTLPTVKEYLSAGVYNDERRSSLNEVLNSTKCGEDIDIIVHIQ